MGSWDRGFLVSGPFGRCLPGCQRHRPVVKKAQGSRHGAGPLSHPAHVGVPVGHLSAQGEAQGEAFGREFGGSGTHRLGAWGFRQWPPTVMESLGKVMTNRHWARSLKRLGKVVKSVNRARSGG